ncbi:MAG: ATP-binding cassette domain-containing protein [Desulfobacterales bacterium]
MAPESIIQVRDLVARYEENLILDKISFDVQRGEILVILGTSGCGKTTLLRHMIGLNTPSAGQVVIDGDDITSGDETAFNRALRKIGILFQGSALFGSMTLSENIALPLEEYSGFPKNVITNMVMRKLCLVNLQDYANYFPDEISGGMKKRAGLARALTLNPSILFLDEPTAGLDPIISAEIDELMLQINQRIGTTMVIVTHELESIFKVANRVIMLDKETKSVIAEGDPRHLREHHRNPFVKQFFSRKAKPEALEKSI